MMRTVDKAMGLLSHFTPARPEIGLSELARLSGTEKATTRRLLMSLMKHGLVEQNPKSRDYLLGAAFLRFALLREQTRPLKSIIQPVLERLSDETGETAHACLPSPDGMVTIGISEPQRSTRVYVDPAQLLPFHATASGLAYLAFADADLTKIAIESGPLSRFTSNTAVSKAEVKRRLEKIRQQGFAVNEKGFEDDVTGTAGPIFDSAGKPIATIAVAAIASRLDEDSKKRIEQRLVQAAAEITRSIGGSRR